jgi:putative ABC transport system permease protein
VVRLVIAESVRLVLLGIALGVAGATAGSGVLRSLLFGLSPLDPVAYGLVGMLLGVIAVLACYVPARKATRVDPVTALRSD